MKNYRTDEQFNEICESMSNGNWTQAGQECVDYGFYANDLRIKQEIARDNGDNLIEDDFDFAELIEIANKIRGTK